MATLETLKRDSELVKDLTQEAHGFKETLREIEKMPPNEKSKMEREFQETWMAAYNFRIRKMQRDAHLYLGKNPTEVEENKNKLDALILDIPLRAYVSYLERQCKNIQAMFDETKAAYDGLKKEQNNLLAQAQSEKDPVRKQEYMAAAAQKLVERDNKEWILQNTIGMDLFSNISEDVRFIEKIVEKLPQTMTREERTYGESLKKMQKFLTDLRNKIPKKRISSEDRLAMYFSEK